MIGDAGLSALSEALKGHKALTQLSLGCMVLIDSYQFFMFVLSCLSGLTGGNKFKDTGITALCRALTINTTLTQVDLGEHHNVHHSFGTEVFIVLFTSTDGVWSGAAKRCLDQTCAEIKKKRPKFQLNTNPF